MSTLRLSQPFRGDKYPNTLKLLGTALDSKRGLIYSSGIITPGISIADTTTGAIVGSLDTGDTYKDYIYRSLRVDSVENRVLVIESQTKRAMTFDGASHKLVSEKILDELPVDSDFDVTSGHSILLFGPTKTSSARLVSYDENFKVVHSVDVAGKSGSFAVDKSHVRLVVLSDANLMFYSLPDLELMETLPVPHWKAGKDGVDVDPQTERILVFNESKGVVLDANGAFLGDASFTDPVKVASLCGDCILTVCTSVSE